MLDLDIKKCQQEINFTNRIKQNERFSTRLKKMVDLKMSIKMKKNTCRTPTLYDLQTNNLIQTDEDNSQEEEDRYLANFASGINQSVTSPRPATASLNQRPATVSSMSNNSDVKKELFLQKRQNFFYQSLNNASTVFSPTNTSSISVNQLHATMVLSEKQK